MITFLWILVLVPGFLRHSKVLSHVEIMPGKEHCPCEHWGHNSLEWVWLWYLGVLLVPNWTQPREIVLHLLPCTPSEWTQGGGIYQENSAGQSFRKEHGNLIILKIQIVFSLPAATAITQILDIRTHILHNAELLRGKIQIAHSVLQIIFTDYNNSKFVFVHKLAYPTRSVLSSANCCVLNLMQSWKSLTWWTLVVFIHQNWFLLSIRLMLIGSTDKSGSVVPLFSELFF